jgi:hypothetical protein
MKCAPGKVVKVTLGTRALRRIGCCAENTIEKEEPGKMENVAA